MADATRAVVPAAAGEEQAIDRATQVTRRHVLTAMGALAAVGAFPLLASLPPLPPLPSRARHPRDPAPSARSIRGNEGCARKGGGDAGGGRARCGRPCRRCP